MLSSARVLEEDDGDGGDEGKGDNDDCLPSPLFVDGIADEVGYLRVRELFYLFGKLRNVFIQREKKKGRTFRFGFVRFLYRNNAVSAMRALNGLKVGGSTLRVSWAKPSSTLKVVEATMDRGKGGKPTTGCKDTVCNEDRRKRSCKDPGAPSWRDIVLSRARSQAQEAVPASCDQEARGEEGCGVSGGATAVRLCQCGACERSRGEGDTFCSSKILNEFREVASECFSSITADRKSV